MKRAKEHLAVFNNEARVFIESHAYEVVSQEDGYIGEARKGIVRVRITQYPPPRLSAVLSDILHNFRSTLDNLVWQIVSAAGNTPTEANEFPIFHDSSKYAKGIRRRLAGVGPDERTIIEGFQPYNRSPDDPTSDPLWLLHELSRIDKHRALHVVLGTIQKSRFGFDPVPGVQVRQLGELRTGPVEDEAQIMTYTIEPKDAEVQVNLALAFAIHFEPGSPAQGAEVVETMNHIGKRLVEILDALNYVFPPSAPRVF